MQQAGGIKQCIWKSRMACQVVQGEGEEQSMGGTCSIGPDQRHPGVAVDAELDILQRRHAVPQACLVAGAALRPSAEEQGG